MTTNGDVLVWAKAQKAEMMKECYGKLCSECEYDKGDICCTMQKLIEFLTEPTIEDVA
jgi:hypothetical protein